MKSKAKVESVRAYGLDPCPLCREPASYNAPTRRAWCHNGWCHLSSVLLTRHEWRLLSRGRLVREAKARGR
jgi:hypothetical protein